MNKLLLLTILVFFFLSGCKKDDTASNNKQLKGLVEKGPFVRGSKVSIIELDNSLTPTGRIFETEIQNNEGFFELANVELASRYVQISVSGFYFNEITGTLSRSQISLGAFADIEAQTAINVNVLTHIEQRRVKHLISKEKKSFADAKKQAQNEILQAFYIEGSLDETSERISITGKRRASDILLGISAAVLNGINSESELTERLSSISENIETTGKLDEGNNQYVKASIENLFIAQIISNIQARYESLGKQVVIGDLADCFTLTIKEPEGPVIVTPGDLLSDEAAFVTALKAAMQRFADFTETYYLIEGLYSGSERSGATIPTNLQPFHEHDVLPYNNDVLTLFSKSYQVIGYYNMLADHASRSADPQLRKFEYVSRPYLAYIYWAIMELWGDAAYVTPQNYQNFDEIIRIQRTSASAIRKDLIAKLELAAQHAFTQPTDFQFNREMVLALLMRLSLQEKDYQKAKAYAAQIIQSNKYALAASADLHSTSGETILGYKQADYEGNGSMMRSSFRSVMSKGSFVHALRYTEVLLAMAEACVETGDLSNGEKYLNQVRLRNNKQELNSSDKETLMNAIAQEVKEDLGGEGLWFSMLKRHGLAPTTLNIPDHKLLLPIPQREVDVNPNMTQNPGY